MRHCIDLFNHIQSPGTVSSKIKGFLFAWYIGGSFSSAAVNLTQTFTTTLPYLHQFGTTSQVTGIMRKAMSMAVDSKKLTGDIAIALKRADEEGVTAPHELHSLMSEANRIGGLPFIPQLGHLNKTLRPLSKAWSSMFQSAEAYNRRVAFISAYKLAKENKHDDPFKFAEDAVKATQFIYSKANQPKIAHGEIGQILATFKMFSLNYIEFLGRLPPKEKAIAFTILFLLAGLSGLPFAEDAEDIIDTIGQASGHNTNSKEWIDKLFNQAFGVDMGRFMQEGASYTTPIDLSGRFAVSNLIPGTGILKRSETDKSRDVLEFAGAAGSLIKKGMEGYEAAMSHNDLSSQIGAGMKSILPKAVSDAYQAMDMMDSGQYKDFKGRKVVDTDTSDAIMKALGFQPNKVAQPKRIERFLAQDSAMLKVIKSDITDLWAQGIYEKDASKIKESKQLMQDWNENNKETPVNVKMTSIIAKVKSMRQTSAERLLKSTPKEMRGYAADRLND